MVLSASASSGLPVVFQVVSGPASLGEDGVTLSLTGQPGTVVVNATQPGGPLNGIPYAAASLQRSFSVTKVPQTISFLQPLTTLSTNAGAFSLTANATSGLPIAYSVTGPATVAAGQLTLTGKSGVVNITATQIGDNTYAAAGQVVRSFTVKAPTLAQKITFTAPATKSLGSVPVLLVASSSSALPVTLTVVSGSAVFAQDNRTLTLTDTGTVVLRATQAGDTTYLPAPPVERVIIVPGNTQKITFVAPSPLTYGEAPRALEATASSGLPVSFERVSGPAELTGGVLKITGAGPILIRAVQPGGSGFGPALAVTRTITVNKAPLAVTFDSATRLVRKPSPAFPPSYSGFVNDDTAADLAATRPVGKTNATLASPEGDYPITFIGGLDANYRFVSGEPAYLTVQGFGGAYEALLVDEFGTPRGKLELLVPADALTYTGTLNLASEPVSLSIRGSLSATDGTSAIGSWSRVANTAKHITALSLGFELVGDTLDGQLSRPGLPALTIGSGTRLFVQSVVSGKKQNAPWTGLHTLVLRDPTPLVESDTRALPLGAGHASASIAATGVMTLKGKLADGTTLTGAAAADANGRFRLYVRPYAKRLDSFLSGELTPVAHPDQTRFSGRFHLDEGETTLFWAKAKSPTKPIDSAHRTGFEVTLVPLLDPWLAPNTKTTLVNGITLPAGTLAQRLDLSEGSLDSALIAVTYSLAEGLNFGARANWLPVLLTLSAKGYFSVIEPVTTPVNLTAFTLSTTPATGAFSGSFILSDQVSPPPAKPVTRKATFSGTLRQGPTGSTSTVGHAHLLFDPVPGDSGPSANEQVSGELILSLPGFFE